MIVDEDELTDIQPLPNLDYKIMQGNSLLEEFDGVRLLDDKLLQAPDAARQSEITEIKARINSLSKEVFRHHDAGKKGAAQKFVAEQDISRLRKRLDALVHPAYPHASAQGELNQQASWSNLLRIQELHSKFFDEESRIEKDKLRRELDKLEWDFMEATLCEQGREDAIAELKRASVTHRKPFFLWRLQFGEVFRQRGGFDVVIANPPFVRMELIKTNKPALEKRFSHLFAGRADLYIYFHGLGFDILRDGGCLTFISSNTYLNAKFAQKLRKHFCETGTIETLIDFAETRVFDAVVEPAIIILKKAKSENSTVSCVKWRENQLLHSVSEIVRHSADAVPQNSFSGEPWRLVGGAEARLLEKLNRGTRLREIAMDGILYGVKTGLNSAFIIDDTKRRELCKDRKSLEIIKPFIRGRDISRWAVRPIEAWLIYTYHDVDISRYPLIKEHLRPFKGDLEARATQQEWYELQQPQFRYSKLFAKPKVVYQDISRTYAFAYDKDGCFCGDTTFVLPTSSLAIVGILQSSAMKWWAHTDQGVPFGGFLRLKAQYMERCPIPKMSEQHEKAISRLVDRILAAKQRDAEVDVSALEREIDQLVYALYGLTPEEIKIVEGASSAKGETV